MLGGFRLYRKSFVVEKECWGFMECYVFCYVALECADMLGEPKQSRTMEKH